MWMEKDATCNEEVLVHLGLGPVKLYTSNYFMAKNAF